MTRSIHKHFADPVPPPEPETHGLVLATKIAAICIESIALTLLVLGQLSVVTAITGHIVLVGTLVLVIVGIERAGGGTSRLQMFTFLVGVAGPLGGAAALVIEQLAMRRSEVELAAWYDLIAPMPEEPITLADRIRDDQLVRADSRLPVSHKRLMSSGTLKEKQAFFASIAAEARPESVELLRRALRSRDQRVKVQAAAVSSHLRARARASHGDRAAVSGHRTADEDAAAAPGESDNTRVQS